MCRLPVSLFLLVESEDFTDFGVSESNVAPSVANEHFCCWKCGKFLFTANVWNVREIGGPWTDDWAEPWLLAVADAASALLFCKGDVGSCDSRLSEWVLSETEYLTRRFYETSTIKCLINTDEKTKLYSNILILIVFKDDIIFWFNQNKILELYLATTLLQPCGWDNESTGRIVYV